MSELISRQAAIETFKDCAENGMSIDGIVDALEQLPPAQPEQRLDEWCTDCKEYDTERHCCPRWNKVIRQTLADAQPQRTGKWILDRSGAYCCSECLEPCAGYVMMKPRDKFCKMCGAKMEGSAE